MKRLITAAFLLAAAPVVAQIGQSALAVPPGVGTTAPLAQTGNIGTTSFENCSISCTASPTRIFITDETVDENAGFVYLTISIAPSSAQTVSVKYKTKNGSAKHPKDYDKVMGTMIFAAGEAFKQLAVPIIWDDDAEPQEDFFVELSQPVNAILEDDQGKVTINDVPLLAVRGGIVTEQPVTFSAIATPNPSASSFSISVSSASQAKIHLQVYDAVGRRVQSYVLQPGTFIQVGKGLQAGVYTVQVMQENHTATLRLLKL